MPERRQALREPKENAGHGASLEMVVPILRGTAPVGMIRQGSPHPGREPEMYIEYRTQGIVMLMPCRRVDRMEDPDHLYLAQDGSKWIRPGPDVNPAVLVEVVRCPDWPSRACEGCRGGCSG
ncbi:MAG: hypothetical protein M0Z36_06645 [Thermaerobacter sp.]|nr:hypothetical protein [Thermaerobacter sp.]